MFLSIKVIVKSSLWRELSRSDWGLLVNNLMNIKSCNPPSFASQNPPPLQRRLMLRIHLISHLRWQLPLKGEAFRNSSNFSCLPLEGKIPPRCGGNVTKWQRGTAPSEGDRRTAVDEVFKTSRQTVICWFLCYIFALYKNLHNNAISNVYKFQRILTL